MELAYQAPVNAQILDSQVSQLRHCALISCKLNVVGVKNQVG